MEDDEELLLGEQWCEWLLERLEPWFDDEDIEPSDEDKPEDTA